jgi:hypothetical protein
LSESTVLATDAKRRPYWTDAHDTSVRHCDRRTGPRLIVLLVCMFVVPSPRRAHAAFPLSASNHHSASFRRCGRASPRCRPGRGRARATTRRGLKIEVVSADALSGSRPAVPAPSGRRSFPSRAAPFRYCCGFCDVLPLGPGFKHSDHYAILRLGSVHASVSARYVEHCLAQGAAPPTSGALALPPRRTGAPRAERALDPPLGCSARDEAVMLVLDDGPVRGRDGPFALGLGCAKPG